MIKVVVDGVVGCEVVRVVKREVADGEVVRETTGEEVVVVTIADDVVDGHTNHPNAGS